MCSIWYYCVYVRNVSIIIFEIHTNFKIAWFKEWMLGDRFKTSIC